MGGTPVTSVPGCKPGNGFGDVDRPVQIRVDRVSAFPAPEPDSVSVRLFPMTTPAGLAGVFGVDHFHPNARHPCLVADHLFQLIKRPGVEAASRLRPGPGPVPNLRQVFHANDANTVGHRKIDNLTADLVIVIFHLPGFPVPGLSDRIQFFGFAQLPPSGSVSSAYVGTLVPFKKQGPGSDAGHGQIPKTKINAHHLFALAGFHIERERQGNEPFSLFPEEFGSPLPGCSCHHAFQPLLLIRPGNNRNPDSFFEGGKGHGVEIPAFLHPEILVVEGTPHLPECTGLLVFLLGLQSRMVWLRIADGNFPLENSLKILLVALFTSG
jgi:hypothetical protein